MRRLVPCIILVLSLLCACQLDPYLVQSTLTDGGTPGDGWPDTTPIPDSVFLDSVDPNSDAGSPDPDACVPRTEVCNNLDDDCDGQTDENFDKLSDPLYCESCKGCTQLLQNNAYPDCQAGSCVIKSCFVGFEDIDKQAANGCEYACITSGPEICDGIDNDCDGPPCTADVDCAAAGGHCGASGRCVDEGVTKPAVVCKDLGPCTGATANCMGAQGWRCVYSPDVELQPCTTDADCGGGITCTGGVCPGIVIIDEKLCDGKDGDCDGVADDPWANPALPNALGKDCTPDPSKLGICRDAGSYTCNAAQTGAECKLTQAGQAAKDELCNGKDDDCDGLVDEAADDLAGKGVKESLVHIQRTVGSTSYDFYIYAHEASRPDADATSAGTMSLRSCSKAGALPWGMVTYAEADSACKAAGMRLCTGAEWTVACQGATPTLYPYGDTYQPQTCNGVDSSAGGKPVPTGSLSSCEGGESGLFDMSGNLREWTSQSTGTTSGPNPKTVYVVRGGAYHTPSMGLSCTFSLSQAVEDVVLPAIGFRCCLDGP